MSSGAAGRRLVYLVATSVDGFIAREDGSFEDFPWDEAYLAELFARWPETFPAHYHEAPFTREENRRFDAVLMGRRTYEVGLAQGITNPYPTLDQYVFSRTMSASPDPAVELISDGAVAAVAELKARRGKEIWLCGGSEFAAELLAADLIDRLVVKLNPVILGRGIPLFGTAPRPATLKVVDHTVHESGHAAIEYDLRV